MIWIKEGKEVVGYVPFFEREFSDLEIKRLIRTSRGDINHPIIKLLFDVQAIYTSQYDIFEDQFYHVIPSPIAADISFEFSKITHLLRNSNIEQYENDVLNVFIVLQNIRFYKVEQHSYSVAEQKDIIEVSERNAAALNELQEELKKNDLPLELGKLFVKETAQCMIDKAYAKRMFKPKEYDR